MTTVGVVGLGYWGPNLARNFDRLPDAELSWLCAGKHCFVEKPLGRSEQEAEAVVEAARAAQRVLMVGHLLEYHPGVERLAELVRSGELGDLRYIYSNRLNLGKHRQDENALWSLGAHDVSVILRLAGEEPYECTAVGESYVKRGVEDVVFAFMRFESGLTAHMHLSWLSGDVFSPRVPNEEPLRIECTHFLDCVRDGAEPRSGGESALRVVRVLERLQRSLVESSHVAGG